ncbi:MAG: hypothetical protein M1124_00475 [Candidatus Marsarchaeota archaeon]|nr:hypothetical protein [Candidatus Marsarchaeota archaeon]
MPSFEILDDKENSKSSESFFESIDKLIEPKITTVSKQQDSKPESELLRENLRNHEIEGLTDQYKKSEQELLRKSGKPEPELLRENLRNHEIEGLTDQYKKSEQELLRKSERIPVPQQVPAADKSSEIPEKA